MESREERRFIERHKESLAQRLERIDKAEECGKRVSDFLDKVENGDFSAFEDINYIELMEIWPEGLIMSQSTKEAFDEMFLTYAGKTFLETYAREEFNFDITKIILKQGKLGEASAFNDILTLSILLKFVSFPQERIDVITSKLMQKFFKNAELKLIGHIVLKEIDSILPNDKLIVAAGNKNIRKPIPYFKTAIEWKNLFATYFSNGPISEEDKTTIRHVIYEFLLSIGRENLLYHKTCFVPFVQYLVNHSNIPTRSLAKMMYLLAYGCIKDGEPEAVLFMQLHLNQLGKFKTTTTYEEASKVLDSLEIPRILADFMLSSLEKEKVVDLSSKSTIPFIYEKEVTEEVVEEEKLLTEEEREMCNIIYEMNPAINKADLALLVSLQDASIAEVFATLEDISRDDLKEAFLVMQGKKIIVDLHALEELYLESSDESLKEEKDPMMNQLRTVYQEIQSLQKEQEAKEIEKTKELYYFTRIEGEDCLSDMNRLDKQHKKDLSILLGKLQSGKAIGAAININCNFLGGQDVILYYATLPNGMKCVLRIFPGEELNTSREFLKDAKFWDDFNALRKACEAQDSSWQYYMDENEKAKETVQKSKCVPILEKKQ